MKLTEQIDLGDGAVASIINPQSFTDGGVEWRLRYGSCEEVKYQAASLIESYDYLLSGHISTTEAIRRLRTLRAGRAALAQGVTQMVSLQYVRALLEYDPLTGNLSWLETRGRATKGNVAGRVSRDGYIQIGIDGKRYPAHRLGWLIYHGAWPKDQLDHINMIKTDNRICNLREATNQQNQYNRGLQSNNKSGIKGVSWNKAQKKWLARIRADKKLFHLGSFNTKEEAHQAYVEAAKRLHGEFERTAA